MPQPTTEATEKSSKVDLGLLEEDDEFEEFPAEGKFTHVLWMNDQILTSM
jgi:hypothetical protein